MLPATNADISRAPRDRRMCMAVLPFERLRRRLFDPGRITNGISSVHDVIVAIDVKRLAGDEARGVVRQESGGDAHIVDAHQTARRRFRLGPVEQGVEFGKSARMEGDTSQLGQQNPHPRAIMSGHLKYVLTADMSPDDKMLVTGGGNKDLNLWGVTSGRLIGHMQGHTSDIESVQFSLNGRVVVSA